MTTHDLEGAEWSVPPDAATEDEREASAGLSGEDASQGSGMPGAKRGSGRPFTSDAAKKAAEKSAVVRRARAEARLAEGVSDREKIAAAMGKVPQSTWDRVVSKTFEDAASGTAAERRGSVQALARLLDQAYGRTQPLAPQAEDQALGADGTGVMTREEKEAFVRRLDALLEEDAPSET